MQQWPAAFFNGKFQQTTKTNPQKISVAFFGFHDAQESRFFSPKHFAQTCATSPRHLFFCGWISARGRQGRHSCRVASWRRKWHRGNTAWLFTLERLFFTHIEREQQKKQNTPFSPWLFGWYRVWKFSPVNISGLYVSFLPFFQILSDPLVRVPSWLMQRILCSMARDNRQTVKLSLVSVVEFPTYNHPKKLRGFVILLMEEIPNNHLTCMKPLQIPGISTISTGAIIFSINNMSPVSHHNKWMKNPSFQGP